MNGEKNSQTLPLNEASRAKAELRNRIQKVLRNMPPSSRREASLQAMELISKQGLWQAARTVLLYAPLPEELDIWPLASKGLEEGKQVLLPRYIPERKVYAICRIADLLGDLRAGQFGIREPAQHCQQMEISLLDFMLVPGVAFDLHGHRLGRGRGFYDQLLKAARGSTCGVAFDEQIVDYVPVEPHDIHVKSILTPTRWVEI